MSYPTKKEVEAADRMQLARWSRHLPSPGSAFVGEDNFSEKLQLEVVIMNRILDRFTGLGGMTPEISKAIGW